MRGTLDRLDHFFLQTTSQLKKRLRLVVPQLNPPGVPVLDSDGATATARSVGGGVAADYDNI